MRHQKLFLAVGLTLCLAGCGGSVSESLGLGRNSPDEFAVVDRPSLAIPPDFSLRPPEPGAPRPQEVNTRDRATAVVLGEDAARKDTTKSAGEVALLEAAKASKADPRIRSVVDKEAAEKVVASQSLVNDLLFWRSNEVPSTTVDAVAERERLKEVSAEGASVTKGGTPVIEKKKKSWIGM